MTRTTADPAFRAIVAMLASSRSRVLVLGARPGYRKTAVLQSLAEQVGRFTLCDLGTSTGDADLAWTVAEALAAQDEGRAERFAADRMAQRTGAERAPSRDALRREWAIDGGAELFALRDSRGSLTTAHGADLFAELLRAFPAGRIVALVVRSPLPRALRQIVEREHGLVLTAADLCFGFDDTLRVAQELGVSAASARSVHDLCNGWPLVTQLMLALLARDEAADTLESAAVVPTESLLAFSAHRTIAALAPDVREALTVATILGTATHEQLTRVLGVRCDDAVFARLSSLPFTIVSDLGVAVHPEVDALLRSRFETLVVELYERTLRVLTGSAAYVDAARVAIDAGDANRAAAILDAAPPFTAAPVPLAAYGRIVDRIDRAMITRYPNIWIATIPYRSFSVDPATYVREAETIYYCMPQAASRDQRAAMLMLLASAYVNFGRVADADALVKEALEGFARADVPARAAILNFIASVRGIEGRFALARSLAAEAATMAPDQFGENQTLLYIESHEAAYRGKQDRVVVIVDELLRRRKSQDLPLYFAYAAISGAIFSWVNGDDDHFEAYITATEDTVTPGIDSMLAPVIDGARGRPVRFRHEQPWPTFVAMAQIFRAGSAATDEEALEAARAAVAAADARRDPYLRILAHAAAFVLDCDTGIAESRILTDVAGSIESAELQRAVASLVAGTPAGMLEPFVQRVRRQRPRRETRTSLELLSGRVVQDGSEVRLTEKEFELLALVGSTRGALSRDRIGEALWDHLEPEEWRNNFKVTVYRIRKKLNARDTVVADGRGFRIAPAIDVDLRRVETAVREQINGVLSDAGRNELRSVIDAYRSSAAARYERYAWGHQLIARIGEAVCRAGITFATDAYARNAHDDVLWATERVQEIDAFNESACELTMRVLIDRGDQDAARREFQRFAAALSSELGAAPTERLARLARHAR